MKRMDRKEIIERVIKKYGHPRWKVEFACDHLFGAEHPQSAPVKKDKPNDEEIGRAKKAK